MRSADLVDKLCSHKKDWQIYSLIHHIFVKFVFDVCMTYIYISKSNTLVQFFFWFSTIATQKAIIGKTKPPQSLAMTIHVMTNPITNYHHIIFNLIAPMLIYYCVCKKKVGRNWERNWKSTVWEWKREREWIKWLLKMFGPIYNCFYHEVQTTMVIDGLWS